MVDLSLAKVEKEDKDDEEMECRLDGKKEEDEEEGREEGREEDKEEDDCTA